MFDRSWFDLLGVIAMIRLDSTCCTIAETDGAGNLVDIALRREDEGQSENCAEGCGENAEGYGDDEFHYNLQCRGLL